MRPPGGYVGRASHCTIVLKEPSVSNTHLRLTTRDGETWFAEDMRSTNGTALEGAALTGGPHPLPVKGVIRCANIELLFWIEAEPAGVPADTLDPVKPPPTLIHSKGGARDAGQAALEAELADVMKAFEEERRRSAVRPSGTPAEAGRDDGLEHRDALSAMETDLDLEERRPARPTEPVVAVLADPGEEDAPLSEPGEVTRIVAAGEDAEAAAMAPLEAGPLSPPVPFQVPPVGELAAGPTAGGLELPVGPRPARPLELPETIVGRLPPGMKKNRPGTPPDAGVPIEAMLALRGLLDQCLVFTGQFGNTLEELVAAYDAGAGPARVRPLLDRVSVALADLHLLLLEGHRQAASSTGSEPRPR